MLSPNNNSRPSSPSRTSLSNTSKSESPWGEISFFHTHKQITINPATPIGDRYEVDVPGDGNCLFWAVALSYLLPVKTDHNQFKQRFERLFGENPKVDLNNLINLLQNYQIDKPDIFKDQQLDGFVTEIFRNRVIRHIKDNRNKYEPFLENNEPWNNYLQRMLNNGWGGHIEIIAIREILNCHVNVEGHQIDDADITVRDNITVRLKYISDKSHYHYLLHKNDISEINLESLDNQNLQSTATGIVNKKLTLNSKQNLAGISQPKPINTINNKPKETNTSFNTFKMVNNQESIGSVPVGKRIHNMLISRMKKNSFSQKEREAIDNNYRQYGFRRYKDLDKDYFYTDGKNVQKSKTGKNYIYELKYPKEINTNNSNEEIILDDYEIFKFNKEKLKGYGKLPRFLHFDNNGKTGKSVYLEKIGDNKYKEVNLRKKFENFSHKQIQEFLLKSFPNFLFRECNIGSRYEILPAINQKDAVTDNTSILINHWIANILYRYLRNNFFTTNNVSFLINPDQQNESLHLLTKKIEDCIPIDKIQVIDDNQEKISIEVTTQYAIEIREPGVKTKIFYNKLLEKFYFYNNSSQTQVLVFKEHISQADKDLLITDVIKGGEIEYARLIKLFKNYRPQTIEFLRFIGKYKGVFPTQIVINENELVEVVQLKGYSGLLAAGILLADTDVLNGVYFKIKKQLPDGLEKIAVLIKSKFDKVFDYNQQTNKFLFYDVQEDKQGNNYLSVFRLFPPKIIEYSINVEKLDLQLNSEFLRLSWKNFPLEEKKIFLLSLCYFNNFIENDFSKFEYLVLRDNMIPKFISKETANDMVEKFCNYVKLVWNTYKSELTRLNIQEIHKDNDKYYCEIDKNGNKFGPGLVFYNDHTIYFGEFLNNQRHGYGKFICADGTEHYGYYEKDELNGSGEILYPNGDRFTGHFLNGLRHNIGKVSFSNGKKYYGEFIDDIASTQKGSVATIIETDGVYEGEVEDGKKCGERGIYKFKDGRKFVGDWQHDDMKFGTFYEENGTYVGKFDDNQKCDENGFFKWLNDNIYEGGFFAGKINGFGKFLTAKYSYIGNFSDNKKHGYGMNIFKDYIFIGNYSEDKRHGSGLCINNDGSVYNGNFVNNMEQGSGKFFSTGYKFRISLAPKQKVKPKKNEILIIISDNAVIEGGIYFINDSNEYQKIDLSKLGLKLPLTIQNDKDIKSVENIITFINNPKNKVDIALPNISAIPDIYEGKYVEGLMSGEGKVNFSNNSSYTGAYVKGKMHGKGTFKWSNGDEYNGLWEENQMHGHGKFKYSDGRLYIGKFQRGKKKDTNGIYIWANGDTYTGVFQDDMITGYGTYTWANGDTYTGAFQAGKITGQGTYTWANGDTYIGAFQAGKITGQGTYTWHNGDSYEGHFENNFRVGLGTMSFSDKAYKILGEFDKINDGKKFTFRYNNGIRSYNEFRDNKTISIPNIPQSIGFKV